MPSPTPTRPRPPARVAPLAPLALAAAAGVVLDRAAAPWPTSTWGALAAAGFAAAAALSWRPRASVLAAVVAAAALSGGWHHWRWSDLAPDDLALALTDAEPPRPAWVRGVVADVGGFRPGRHPDDPGVTRAVLAVEAVRDGETWRPASGRAALSVPGERPELRPGDVVEAAGDLAAVAPPLNPGEFDYRAYLRGQGVRLRLVVSDPAGVWADRDSGPRPWRWEPMRWLGAVRAWSQGQLARAVDPSAAPLASALLLGRREGVDPDVNDAFARTGTTHLLAISGLHLQVIAWAVGFVLFVLGVSRRATFAAVAVSTVAYALLVGLMPSVVRSAAMTVTYCVGGLRDRPARPANTLAAAALVTLLLNPSDLFDAGCQLSFLAVGAIVWGVGPAWALVAREPDALTAAERYYEPRWRKPLRSAGRRVGQGVAVSVVVWLAAIPLVALRFHLVSPVGVLLNVPLIPLTSLALLAAGLALGLSAVWPPLGWPAGRLCSACLNGTDAVVRWGAGLPGGHAFVPSPPWWWAATFYGLLGLAAASACGRWRGRRVWAALAAVWVVAGGAFSAWPRLAGRATSGEAEVLAVGHGLAVVVTAGDGQALLYDCGRMRDPSVGRRVVAPALWERGVWRLDAVVVSHADADHYNGLPDLLDRFRVAEVRVPPGFAGDPGGAALIEQVEARGVPVRTVTAGERWDVAGFAVTVRHPAAGFDPRAPDNARSVVLDVAARGRHLLLTGDLDGPGLFALTAGPAVPVGETVDVLLSPHHGGRTANPPGLFDWAAPAAVAVSQRPLPPGSRDPLAGLPGRGVAVWRTWEHGALRLRWSPGGVGVAGYRGGLQGHAGTSEDPH